MAGIPHPPNEEERALERRLIDSMTELVRGTSWAPEDGGILVDVLCVMVHVDKDGVYGSSWLSVGSAEQAEGMARSVIRSFDQPTPVVIVTKDDE